MSDTISAATILAALECHEDHCACHIAVRRGNGLTHCPVHGDGKPSLNVSERDGKVLVYCHGQCEQGRVVDALREMKLWPGKVEERMARFAPRPSTPEPEPPEGPPARGEVVEAIYHYTDERGTNLYRIVRSRLASGKKSFVVWHPNGSGWLRSLGGAEIVPFMLPQLMRDATKTAWIPEGEKCAEHLAKLGLVATTSPFGAGKWPMGWGEKYLAGRHVVVLADNDEPGAKHAAQVADDCAGHARSVKVIALPGLEEHGDIVDWLEAGHTLVELRQIVDAAPEHTRTPVTRKEHGLTDLANAERLVERHGNDIRYVAMNERWHIHDGRRWLVDETDEIARRAKDTVRSIYVEAERQTSTDKRRALASHAVKSEASSKISAMIALAKSDAKVALHARELDSDGMLLNVMNGTIDLRTGELRDHRRTDLITKLAPVEYDPDAHSDVFDAFLEQTFGGDRELMRYVQKVAGYSLTGDTREEAMFIAHGPPAAGKTTLAEALRAALGDYAATADPETFLSNPRRDGSAARPDIARLNGRRLVVGVEVDENRRIAEGLVKQLTGGDTVVARHLHKDLVEFRPQFKLWIFANDAPRVRDDDDAIWRRLRLIPFTHPVDPRDRDPKLKLALRDPEIGGKAVLRWAVEGCVMWLAEGLGTPRAIEAATAKYREAQDPVADFIAEKCEVHPDATATSEELYVTYAAWSKAAGERTPLTKKAFGMRLERLGYELHRGTAGARRRIGIGLREQPRLGSATPDDALERTPIGEDEIPF